MITRITNQLKNLLFISAGVITHHFGSKILDYQNSKTEKLEQKIRDAKNKKLLEEVKNLKEQNNQMLLDNKEKKNVNILNQKIDGYNIKLDDLKAVFKEIFASENNSSLSEESQNKLESL